jgi:adenylate cyclase
MFTDMVGYTLLGQKNEALSLALVEEQRRVVRPVLAKHNGREIKTMGDAFLVEFPNAVDAVRCAYDVQRAIREFNLSLAPEKRVHLRIGIHVGEVIETGGDISGDAVNVASRIEPLAEDGGVCLTRQVHDHILNKVDLPMSSLGPKSLKNVSQQVEVYRMTMPWDQDAGRAQLDRKRIAVLPFTNMSPDPNDAYFADGLTEELITTLSGLSEVTVIGRTSIMRYKNTQKSLSEIGVELDAGSLVEGSVRKSADKMRITVQLIDSTSEGHIWAQKYDRRLEDIFAIQSDIAENVTKELKVRLAGSEKGRMKGRPTESTEAYTLYLKGRHYWNERSDEGLSKAIEYFKKAVSIDPSFALGYSALADCHVVIGFNGQAEFIASFEKAREFATKALELDPTLGEAHAVRGACYHNLEFEFEKSEVEMRRAIELNPNYPTAHQWYSQLLWFRRKFEEAEHEIRRAQELDPLSLIIGLNRGDLLYCEGKVSQAVEQYGRVLELDPNFAYVHLSLLLAYVRLRKFEDALKEMDEIGRLARNPWGGKLGKAYVYASMGRKDEATELLKGIEQERDPAFRRPYYVGILHFLLGDADKGFEWLERAYGERDGNLNGLAVDYELDSVRGDPRYLALARKINLLP